jgi:hypothetical protein
MFQNNINNKNKIINSISESYSQSTTFLDEQERTEIASTIIVGGWIETLHLTLNMLKEVNLKKNKADVNDIMLNQQFTLEDLRYARTLQRRQVHRPIGDSAQRSQDHI